MALGVVVPRRPNQSDPTSSWVERHCSNLTQVGESVSRKIRSRHAEQMVCELEAVSLDLFEARGFASVRVEEIAAQAGISPRTFYRHFATKEDVFQVRIDQRAKALRAALADRPPDEVPMVSLRQAIMAVVAAEDEVLARRWMLLVASSSALVRLAIGGIHLKVDAVIAEFFGVRLGMRQEALIPTMLAAAVGGVLRAATTRWVFEGGCLEEQIGNALEVLEGIVGDASLVL